MRERRLAGAALGTVCLIVYWLTAFPSIDWWDSAEYSTAAATMGVTGAPGSLILALLGWPIANLLPGDSPAHRLNLFAGVLAAVAATLIYTVVLELSSMTRARGDGDRTAGA